LTNELVIIEKVRSLTVVGVMLNSVEEVKAKGLIFEEMSIRVA